MALERGWPWRGDVPGPRMSPHSRCPAAASRAPGGHGDAVPGDAGPGQREGAARTRMDGTAGKIPSTRAVSCEVSAEPESTGRRWELPRTPLRMPRQGLECPAALSSPQGDAGSREDVPCGNSHRNSLLSSPFPVVLCSAGDQRGHAGLDCPLLAPQGLSVTILVSTRPSRRLQGSQHPPPRVPCAF